MLTPFQHEIFYVDIRIHVEMNTLNKFAIWIPLIPQLKNLHNSHVIIQALNTTSLCQHYKDINHDHNLQMSHRNNNTLCINICAQIYKFIETFIYFNP